ncbi:WbqC family protein [Pseudomonas cerasi]
MNIAIMQPYLFPYLGYFQLIYQSDIFVLYDDAAFIKQGFINRNNILADGVPMRFSIPVPGASSNKRISELSFSADVGKTLKMFRQHYHHARSYTRVIEIIESVLLSQNRDITACCQLAIEKIFAYLGLERKIIRASALHYDRQSDAQGKVIAICRALGAQTYTNSSGGRKLYQSAQFLAQGVSLRFINNHFHRYPQKAPEFVAGLSIIDLLMNCTPSEVVTALGEFSFSSQEVAYAS